MKTLGLKFPFEVAVGLNGRVWVKGRSNRETVAVVNAILACEHMSNDQIKVMCLKLSDALSGFD